MSNNSDNFNIAFFGSSDHMMVILKSISQNSGKALGQVCSNQYKEIIDKKSSYLDLVPDFWIDLGGDKKLWEHECLNKKIKLTLIVTNPEKELRGKILPNPVLDFANKNGITVYNPPSLKKDCQDLKNDLKKTDIAIVASYGLIIPEEYLDLPKYGMINWHPSKLPEYRGPSPIQASINNADKTSALSWIEVAKGMDAGDVYFQYEMKILPTDNFTSLIKKMADLGSSSWAIVSAIKMMDFINSDEKLLLTTFAPRRQDYNKVTLTKMVTKDSKYINHKKSTAVQIFNHFRAYNEFPGTWIKSEYFESDIKLLEADLPINDEEFLILSKNSSMLEKSKDLFILKSNNVQTVLLKCQSGYLPLKKICLGTGKSIILQGYNFNK